MRKWGENRRRRLCNNGKQHSRKEKVLKAFSAKHWTAFVSIFIWIIHFHRRKLKEKCPVLLSCLMSRRCFRQKFGWQFNSSTCSNSHVCFVLFFPIKIRFFPLNWISRMNIRKGLKRYSFSFSLFFSEISFRKNAMSGASSMHFSIFSTQWNNI